jgi:small multidrug resistance pump
MFNSIQLYIHSFALACLTAFSHLLLKWTSVRGQDRDFLWQIRENWHLIGIALAIYGFVFFYYLWALRKIPLSMLYPIYTSLTIVFVAIAGIFLFKEQITLTSLIGLLCISAGIIIMGLGVET